MWPLNKKEEKKKEERIKLRISVHFYNKTYESFIYHVKDPNEIIDLNNLSSLDENLQNLFNWYYYETKRNKFKFIYNNGFVIFDKKDILKIKLEVKYGPTIIEDDGYF